MQNDKSKHTKYLSFDELAAPVCLENSERLVAFIKAIIPKWRFAQATMAPSRMPCMTISAEAGQKYSCSIPDAAPKKWDALNSVCEMVAELAWEQIRSNPSWLCLHCAAVELNGRLVLFPNGKKAGKSTLTAVLASRGHRVFTDDFLPVEVDQNGFIRGRANGILPRIRLPLPDEFSDTFKRWVADNPGPQNRKYKYLTIDALADRGETLPIGAIVVLDRGERSDCIINPIKRETALNEMISQNFARILHSGKILQASNGVAETAELYRLNFGSAEDAADLLEQKFQCWTQPVRPMVNPQNLPQGCVDLAQLAEEQPAFQDNANYQHASELTVVTTDDVAYLTDASGLGVHRLNSGSAMIWHLLQDPTSLKDAVEVIKVAFPAIPLEEIEADTRKTMVQFVQNRLITSADKPMTIVP